MNVPGSECAAGTGRGMRLAEEPNSPPTSPARPESKQRATGRPTDTEHVDAPGFRRSRDALRPPFTFPGGAAEATEARLPTRPRATARDELPGGAVANDALIVNARRRRHRRGVAEVVARGYVVRASFPARPARERKRRFCPSRIASEGRVPLLPAARPILPRRFRVVRRFRMCRRQKRGCRRAATVVVHLARTFCCAAFRPCSSFLTIPLFVSRRGAVPFRQRARVL